MDEEKTVKQIAYGVNNAARVLDMSRDSMERLIKAGAIKSFKIGANRYVLVSELERFVQECETA